MIHSQSDKRPRGENREQVRARIQQGALSCFSEKGLAGATMAEIASRAGVSPGALYLHFPSKQALFESLGRPDLDQPSARVVERRSQIISAARRVFGHRGYAAATMDEIATAAGMSKAALYGHFQNKEELFLGVLRDSPLTPIEEPWRCGPDLEAAGDEGPAPRDLREYALAFARMYLRVHDEPGRLEVMRFVLAEGMHDAGVAQIILDNMIRHSSAALAKNFEKYGAGPAVDLLGAAEVLLGLLFAWVLRYRILTSVAESGGKPPYAPRPDEETAARNIVEFFLAGLKANPSASAAKRRATKRKP